MQDIAADRALDRQIVELLDTNVPLTLREVDDQFRPTAQSYPSLERITDGLERLASAGIVGVAGTNSEGALCYQLNWSRDHALEWLDGDRQASAPPDERLPRAERLDGLIDDAIDFATDRIDRALGPDPDTDHYRAAAQATAAVDRLLSARLTARELESAPRVEPQLLKAAAATLRRVADMLARVEEHQGRLAPPDGPADLAQGPWQTVRVLPQGFEDVDPGELARLAALLAANSR